MNLDENFLRERITQLRMQKNVSEYQMSLDLGHTNSYIHSISSGRALPSMKEFFSICNYLEVTPLEFFDAQNENPATLNRLLAYTNKLNNADCQLLIALSDRLARKNERQ